MSWDGRIRADARHLPIADGCVQCVVTSPPYWGLRDYGNDGQIGLEKTPAEYVASLVAVFREVRRVLVSDGVMWLNLGDSYSNSGTRQGNRGNSLGAERQDEHRRFYAPTVAGMKNKDLVGIPWMVAFALRADGWYLRRDIIWNKPNPMPESVTDRCTSSHEYIFLLTKSARYFYDADAIAEPCAFPDGPNSPQSIKSPHGQGFTRVAKTWEERKASGEPMRQGTAGPKASGVTSVFTGKPTRNRRSVWTISTTPYPGSHYATFPEEIPEICIKAGSKPGDLILDPFFGSGTVGRVAERLSRRWIGCDLGYQDLQGKRLNNVQRELVNLNA